MNLRHILPALKVAFPAFITLHLNLLLPCSNTSMKKEEVWSNKTNTTITVYHPNLTKVAGGMINEGPAFDSKGNLYAVSLDETSPDSRLFTDGYAGRLYKINVETGEKSIACTPWVDNFGGRPAGCQADREGNIWIADLRLGLLKYTPGEDCVQISKADSEGNPLRGMNDLIFDGDGNLWITAPGGHIAPADVSIFSSYKENIGVLYFLKRGSSKPYLIPGEKFRYSNGIAIWGQTLYVIEFMTRKIITFDILGPGILGKRKDLVTIPKDSEIVWNTLEIGGPDGMDFDINGRLIVAHWASSHLEVISPNGKLEGRIKTDLPEVTNLQFKPNTCECYVTEFANGSVWKFEWDCRGIPMYSDIIG